MRLFLAVLLLCLQMLPAFADIKEGQSEACPLQINEENIEIIRARQEAGVYDYHPERVQATYQVPLFFHIVQTTAGAGGIPQSQLDQAMIDLEAAFSGSGICFYIMDQDTINNTTYYYIDNDAERSALKAINNHPNAIDCYFVEQDDVYCGVSSFTFSADQGISFDNDCVGLASNPSTFPHEIGHYFDLFHTHEPFYGNECPDGSNCGAAGDLVCDTAADPNISGLVDANCNYTGNASIFCNGATRFYNPDPTNLMSYSTKTCRDFFSAGQVNRMLATLTGPRWGEIGFNAPDFDGPTPAGWSNALVPRNTTGATSGSTPVTATLPGNTTSGTYLNVATHQSNANTYYPGVYSRIYLDNVYAWWYSYGGPSTFTGYRYYNNFGPITVRGGRHSTHVVFDQNDANCETNENDNTDYSQWVWSPYALSASEVITRTTPPEKMTSNYTYPNCDGFEFTGSSWWSAVAIQPVSTTADFDVRLHQDPTSSTNGYDEYLSWSVYGSGSPDWVVVNHNQASFGGTYQVGLMNYDGESASVVLNKVESNTVASPFDGVRYPGTLANNVILGLKEMYLTAGQEWTASLVSEATQDLDLYLYGPDLDYFDRNDYMAIGAAANTPNESFTFTVATSGWHCFAIGRDSSDDLAGEAIYELRLNRAEDKLDLYQAGPAVALFKDNDPWSSTEWQDQLDAYGLAYTVLPTSQLATFDLYDYDVVIVPSQTLSSAQANVHGALSRLDDFNQSGGVLVLSTCYYTSTSDGQAWLDGITHTWAQCETVIPNHHFLTTGPDPDGALGNDAVHYVYDSAPVGWQGLAFSSCDSMPTVLFNESRGAIMYGAPMEHSELYYDFSLGEIIENIVIWTEARADATVRLHSIDRLSDSQSYGNPSALATMYTVTESLSWLSVTPTSGTILPGFAGFGTYNFVNSGVSEGFYAGTASIGHGLFNDPATVYAYLNVQSRKPIAPIVVDIYPVDFTAGNAIVHATWTPVVEDVDGNPVSVDYYVIYYDDDWMFGSPGAESVGSSTDLDLYFHNVGLTDKAFMRITAVDDDGVLLGDSRPDLPLPELTPVTRSSGLVHPRITDAGNSR